MIELIGALVFGGIVGSAWLNDHLNETNRRGNSASDGCPYYFDKNGIMRHTLTGTKYTDQEIHNTLFQPNPKFAEIEDKKVKRYYGIRVTENYLSKMHIFLTKEEADKFYEEQKANGKDVKYEVERFSKYMLESKKCQQVFGFVLHFEK